MAYMAMARVTSSTRHLSSRAQVAIPVSVAVLLVTARQTELIPRDVSLCLFRNITGIPCPMCGGLSAVGQILEGNVTAAWSANPFAVLFIAGAIVGGIIHLLQPALKPRLVSWVLTPTGITVLALYMSSWVFWWALKIWPISN